MSPDLFEKKRSSLLNAVRNEYSSFYRDFYRSHSYDAEAALPQTPEEWGRVPFLAKADVLAMPYERRVFVPHQEVETIGATSGTSGSGVLLVPRIAKEPDAAGSLYP